MTQRKSFETEIEAVDDTAVPRDMAPSLGELWSRRMILKGLGAAGLLTATSTSLVALGACDKPAARGFNFKELARGVDQTHHVAEGYDADILIRWGDPVLRMRPPSIPGTKRPTRSGSSSATTTTMSASCPCPTAPAPATAVSFASITNTPM